MIALDTSPTRLALARHNAAIYGVSDRIEFILADYITFARSFLAIPSQHRARKIDVVFLSPPWGGPSYLSGSNAPEGETVASNAESLLPSSTAGIHPEYHLSSIRPIHGAELFKLSQQITTNIAYYLPRNANLEEISALAKDDDSMMVEVEEEWMGVKLKALTCYFGGLVSGQEHLF